MLPVLDLRSADDDPAEFRRRLLDATHTVGFFYLVGHGVPQDAIDRILRVAREFFALPRSDKDEISMVNSPHFRGYTRLGGEFTNGAVDWREQVDLGPDLPVVDGGADYWNLQGPNQWPSALPEFREALYRWDDRLAALGRRLLAHWAVALGAAPDVFDDAFRDRPATLIKVVRYPGSDQTPQGVGAHKDSGVLTLLLVEPGSAGLQVQAQDGAWIDAPSLDGAFIVNIGELLEFATDGYLRATRHRVLAPAPSTDRLSIPYFFNPALDAQIPTLELPPALASDARGVEDDPANPIYGTYGENAWKSRTRAHPDVAARHHGIVPTGDASAY